MPRSPADAVSTLAEPLAAALPVIQVTNMRKRWPRAGWPARRDPATDVLANVNLTVARGEIVVVLGENGAGKTTLLKIIGGLARADAGDVRVLGADAASAAPELRRRVAYAGGERGFYYRLTARENLEFFGALERLSPRALAGRIVEVARTVDIEAQLDERFAKLSTGQAQRLGIARALLADPQVLLLDEPTRALDPPHAAELRRFVREALARRAGKTIVVATNLIDEAIELGNRIAVLRDRTLSFVDVPSPRIADLEIRALFGMAGHA